MLEAKGIKKSFGSLEILRSVDLTIEKSEVLSIVGSSGAGKTTLLQILGTLDRADHGSLSIDGQKISDFNDRKLANFRNCNIGFIFQFHQLLPEFTALENAMLPALIQGKSKEEAKKSAEKHLSILGLQDRLLHQPQELSGGEQQRVAVARALVNQPKIIFADEPSGNLDSQNSEALHKLFFDLREEFGFTFVIVTHNEKLAEMADRKLIMKDGQFFN